MRESKSRTRRLVVRAALAASTGAGAAAALVFACGPTDFTDESFINSVRILATSSDQPYARPGATVRAAVLAVDARPDASTNEPMRVFWLPFLCVNPPNDAFYACFSGFLKNPSGVDQYGAADGGGGGSSWGTISAWDGGLDAAVGAGLGLGLGGGADAGAGGGGVAGKLADIPAGTDVSPFLIQGPRAVFQLPPDIVSSHTRAKGATQYGLAVVFNIACAGHVEVIPLDPTNPNPEQIPFGCFNAAHAQLTPSDYVIGYSQVFAYDTLTNTNPVITSFAFRDAGVPLEGGAAPTPVAFPHCQATKSMKCNGDTAVTGIPDASWEPDPQNPGPDGGAQHEQIWVDYYSTIGTLSDEAILSFDPVLGRITPKDPETLQVNTPRRGTLWAVAHDNRNGVSWITVPLNAR